MTPSPLVGEGWDGGEEQGGSVSVRGNEQDRFDFAILLTLPDFWLTSTSPQRYDASTRLKWRRNLGISDPMTTFKNLLGLRLSLALDLTGRVGS